MKKFTRILIRILKVSGITLVSFLILLFLAPYLFPDTVGKEIKRWTNQSIKGDLNFTQARLSFFTHFPSLTLTLYDVDLKGSVPYQQDTLLSAAKLGFGVNLKKLIFDHQVSINKIFLTGAFIHVMVNESGQANYNIYVSDTTRAKPVTADSSTASLHLEKIIIKDSRLLYNDLSVPILIQAEHLYYEGTGDLSKSIFDLESHIRTDSLNFILNNQPYVKRKAIDASLITHVNTKTLELIFENNKLRMNKLNLAFAGKLDFLKNGYDIDFSLSTQNADLYQLITVFPPQYLDWLRKTTVKGNVSLTTSLKGKYIASTGQMPDYKIKLSLRDGYIAYQDTKLPVSQINLNTEVELPSLDPEKLHIKIDSLNFRLDHDFFHCSLESHGVTEPEVNVHADAQMDLKNLKQATGISMLDMQGQLKMNLSARGKYERKVTRISLRKTDTVVASIPSFDFQCSLQNGFVKYYKVAQPIQNIFISMNAVCKDADYRHAYFKIDSLHAGALKNYIEGKAIVHASSGFPLDVNLKGNVDLSEIKEIYPLDSLTLSGFVRFDISSKGKYAPANHLFPKTIASFSLRDGFIRTAYYPHPVEKINIDFKAEGAANDLKSLQCSINPASLSFEGKPIQHSRDF